MHCIIDAILKTASFGHFDQNEISRENKSQFFGRLFLAEIFLNDCFV